MSAVGFANITAKDAETAHINKLDGTAFDRINISNGIGNLTGFDLVWSQGELKYQMQTMMTNIYQIQQDANLSDTEKMFSIQMAMNTWSAVANLRTNQLKAVADVLKATVRNVA